MEIVFALWALTSLGVAVWFVLGISRLPRLPQDTALHPLPKVSMIVPAKDEADTLPQALPTWLNQHYPDFEVIVLDDRSTDGTRQYLSAQQHPKLRTVLIDTLPPGWMGKSHALFQGARQATGDWLLFVDADVHLAPDTLARSVGRADHVTLLPRLKHSGAWFQAVTSGFALFFNLYHQPWQAANPRSKQSLGVGAFNLLRREVYEAIGTHAAFAMAADDDLTLGRRVKAFGFSQAVFWNAGVSVAWYPNARALQDGLVKNTYALLKFQPWRAVVGILTLVAFGLHFAMPGYGWTLFWVWFTVVGLQNRLYGLSPWGGWALPWVALVFARVVWTSARQRRVVWRNTVYPHPETQGFRVKKFTKFHIS
jgi:glycosyltransferase involved in cell wall biosynthesis